MLKYRTLKDDTETKKNISNLSENNGNSWFCIAKITKAVLSRMIHPIFASRNCCGTHYSPHAKYSQIFRDKAFLYLSSKNIQCKSKQIYDGIALSLVPFI